MTATATTALVPLQPAFSDAERLALAGFLAGYRSLTREAYALDLRQFTAWRQPECRRRRRASVSPLVVCRTSDGVMKGGDRAAAWSRCRGAAPPWRPAAPGARTGLLSLRGN
jgi:hypothetical protein